MSSHLPTNPVVKAKLSDLGLVMLALGLFVISALTKGQYLVENMIDNDSMLRLVQVRDLINGQGWYDTWQYRMGPQEGFSMHWSRLLDVPLALLILAGTAVGGSQAIGESAAILIWPTFVLGVALYAILRAARHMGGPRAVLPALLIAGVSFFGLTHFSAGIIDHHNIQIALVLVALGAMLHTPFANANALLSAVALALSLSVSAEAHPFVLVGCLIPVARLIAFGDDEVATTRTFGFAFAGTVGATYVASIMSNATTQLACDAFSSVHTVLGVLGGTGLALTAMFLNTLRARLFGILSLAVIVGVVAMFVFPHCLDDPYGKIDPLQQKYWLSHISEAQSFTDIIFSDLKQWVGFYATPLLALFVMLCQGISKGWSTRRVILLSFLIVAILISLWQVRGALFALAIAVIPLAAWVARFRDQLRTKNPGKYAALRMATAWLLSVNLVWSFLASAASASLQIDSDRPAVELAKSQAELDSCRQYDNYALLGSLPPSRLLNTADIGASILVHTQHHPQYGPYHRNVAGNHAAIQMLIAKTDEEALARIRNARIQLVVICPSAPESSILSRLSPDGFFARISSDKIPNWLELVPQSEGEKLLIYRVKP